jgi:hypothetical protein
MRGDELVVISKAELEALKKQAEQNGQRFDSEEMQVIRDQYQELIEQERARREELEFKLRVELARIRDAELNARRSAEEVRHFEQSMLAILEEGTEPQPRSAPPTVESRPRPAPTPTPQPPPVSVALKPVPPAPPAKGSQVEKFRQAMAHRKRYSA